MFLPGLNEPQYRFFDIAVKMLVIVAGAWAFYKYRRSLEQEARKPLWEKQLALFIELCNATAELAIRSPDDPSRRVASDTFYRLFFGAIALVEDKNIDCAMRRFKKELESGASPQVLMARSVELANACREAIGTRWDIRMGTVRGRYFYDSSPDAQGLPREPA